MHTVLQYSPGQIATVTLSVMDQNNVLTDGYTQPVVTKILMPNLTSAAGFPVAMQKIDTGLYRFSFQIPSGAVSVGSYVVVMTYTSPGGAIHNEVVEIKVSAPFANFSASPG